MCQPLPLLLPPEPYRENRYGAAVGVEGRVADELVIHREVSGLPDGKIVIGFQHFFRAVGQVAVAVQYARAARLQECDLLGRSAAQNTGKADSVVGPIPFAPLTLAPSDADQLASVYVHAAS